MMRSNVGRLLEKGPDESDGLKSLSESPTRSKKMGVRWENQASEKKRGEDEHLVGENRTSAFDLSKSHDALVHELEKRGRQRRGSEVRLFGARSSEVERERERWKRTLTPSF